MIVFLGLPKTGSSWIYANLKYNVPVDQNRPKEPHVFNKQYYFLEEDISHTFDFTTQNWSMDSGLAKQLDQYVEKYFYLARNPLHLIRSWHDWANTHQSFEQTQLTSQFSRLCDIGSILERWYHLVGKDKIVVDIYENLKKDQEQFFRKTCKKLSISVDVIHKSHYINKSVIVTKKPVFTESFLHQAVYETKKFEEITGINTGYLNEIYKEIECLK